MQLPSPGFESFLGNQEGLTSSALKGVGHLGDGLHRVGYIRWSPLSQVAYILIGQFPRRAFPAAGFESFWETR